MKDQLYVDKDQLMELIGVGPKKAYQIIRDVNKELAAAGFIIIKGRCPRKYLFKRLGIVEGTEEKGADEYVLQGICCVLHAAQTGKAEAGIKAQGP